MVAHKCNACGKENTEAKRCAGCRVIWYCSADCQKTNWPLHIFDCKPNKPINPVYHLFRACHRNHLPIDAKTLSVYFFDKVQLALGGPACSELLRLYGDVFSLPNVTIKDVRTWQEAGCLAPAIMAAFDPIPPVFRGDHFTWFLANRALLTDAPLDKNQQQRNGQDEHEQALRKVWALSGGSRDESPAVIEAKMLALPLLRRKCIKFCFILMFGEAAIPNPSSQSQTECWLDFGFVGASGEDEERDYCAAYHELIERRCTWSEFCAAFESKTIPALFTRHSLSLPNPRLFADVMSGSPHDFKSVWRLKHYVVRVISSEPGHTFLPELSASTDYGYANAKDPSERKLLDDLYIELLTKRRVDPLDLHDACMRGGLLEYAKTFVKLSPWTAKYQRLLKNRYPLRGSVRHVAGTITQS